ncbi:MAG: helix-turn-helix transcriptional regulator [Pseudomonadota bacterium]
MSRPLILWLAVAVQIVCATFFVGEILVTLFGLPLGPIDWQVHEAIEISAAVGLILGGLLGGLALRKARAEAKAAQEQLRAASGAFMELVEDRFAEWGLTKAERDVALFVVKGMSTAEIAGLRNTSEGTVKAQTNAIYRKAGVSNRAQLVSHFVEDLMADPLV